MTATHPEGLGASKAMAIALKEARVSIDQVDYLNVHATSTPVGDLSEIKAILSLTGNNTSNMLISSTKSMTGHLLGAAGAVEAIITLLSMRDNIVPPTINTMVLDAAIPGSLNIITKASVDHKVKVAMSNTFGFGGHNGIVVFQSV
jgi:3-oxoacyl-[acyl-carrier-protein] synthase II